MAFIAAIPAMLSAVGASSLAGSTAAGLASMGIAPTAIGGVSALSAAGSAMGAIGTGMGIVGSISQAQTQAAIYEQNAKLAERKGEAERIAGKEKTRQLSVQQRKAVGAQVAAYGGAGVDLTGSPLDVMADTYANYERDIQTTGYNADVARRTGQAQADIYRWGASRASATGYMNAGTTLLTSVGQSLLGSREF